MYKNILVALDGSEEAKSAIGRAKVLAKSMGATIHLVHVIEHVRKGVHSAGATRYPTEMNFQVEREYEEGQIIEESDYLADLAAPLRGEGIQVETSVDSGDVSHYIAAYAERNAIDLIVITKHGHGGVKHLLIGSVTDRVIRSVNADVLVVHIG